MQSRLADKAHGGSSPSLRSCYAEVVELVDTLHFGCSRAFARAINLNLFLKAEYCYAVSLDVQAKTPGLRWFKSILERHMLRSYSGITPFLNINACIKRRETGEVVAPMTEGVRLHTSRSFLFNFI